MQNDHFMERYSRIHGYISGEIFFDLGDLLTRYSRTNLQISQLLVIISLKSPILSLELAYFFQMAACRINRSINLIDHQIFQVFWLTFQLDFSTNLFNWTCKSERNLIVNLQIILHIYFPSTISMIRRILVRMYAMKTVKRSNSQPSWGSWDFFSWALNSCALTLRDT